MSRIARSLAAIVLLAGCGSEPSSPSAARPRAASDQAAEHRDVARLRAATARYHRIEVARADGWDTQFPPGCFTSGAGAMGFHFIKGANVGTLSPAAPQLLLYEPQADGTMRLVGVEFILPGDPGDEPPVLFGRAFSYNTTFQVWALHVWAWRENPRGLYADYNPKVTCANAGAVARSAHH
jgi:hypothetical protein